MNCRNHRLNQLTDDTNVIISISSVWPLKYFLLIGTLPYNYKLWHWQFKFKQWVMGCSTKILHMTKKKLVMYTVYNVIGLLEKTPMRHNIISNNHVRNDHQSSLHFQSENSSCKKQEMQYSCADTSFVYSMMVSESQSKHLYYQ